MSVGFTVGRGHPQPHLAGTQRLGGDVDEVQGLGPTELGHSGCAHAPCLHGPVLTGDTQAVPGVGPAPRPMLTSMSALLPGVSGRADPADPRPPVLDVVVPVHNEETDLEPCLRRLHAHLRELPYPFRITVAENASTDGTATVAARVAAELPGVEVLVLPEAGRGRALRTAWLRSDAPVLVYMDVDLSTDLAALLPLVAPLISGHSDLAIGTRLSRSSRVVRGVKREVISRGYNLLLRRTLATSLSDAQCGFKAIRGDVARRLLPLVEDAGWFFDTELLVLAERAGLRIHEVPVDWIDDPDSRVDIVATARADLAGIARMLRAFATGRLPVAELRAQIGRRPLPDPVPGVPAGLVDPAGPVRPRRRAVHARLPGDLRAAARRGRRPAGQPRRAARSRPWPTPRPTGGSPSASAAAAARPARSCRAWSCSPSGWRSPAGRCGACTRSPPPPSRTAEVALLLTANAAATLLRFVLFRGWVFRPRTASTADGVPAVLEMETAR